MKYTIKIISLIAILFALTSCNRDIILEESYTEDLVVNAVWYPNSKPLISVSHTAPVGTFDTNCYITNARVEIYENGNLIDVPKNLYQDEYLSNIVVSEDKSYELKVKYADKEVRGEIKFPAKPAKPTITLQEDASNFGSVNDFWGEEDYVSIDKSFKTKVKIDDIPGKQYYMILFYTRYPTFFINNKDLPDSLFKYVLMPLHYYIDYSNENGTGFSPEMEFIQGDLPSSLEFPINFEKGIIIPDNFFSEASYSIDLELNISSVVKLKENNLADIVLYYRIVNLSQDLFDYNSSVYKHNMNSFNPFTEPITITSNAEGGLGLITGYNQIFDSLYYTIDLSDTLNYKKLND